MNTLNIIFIFLFSVYVISYDFSIWPLPKSYKAEGDPIGLSSDFYIRSNFQSDILSKMIEIYKPLIGTGSGELKFLQVDILANIDELNKETDYSYTITIKDSSAVITANTIYGGMYGLESFSQLVENGKLGHSTYEIVDEPVYAHRGILIDTGRRFIPVNTVKELLDAMFYNKMNVLHWHLSDFCRVSLESKKFPMLTKSLVDLQAGYYTHEEARDVVQYAKGRGIRVMPEFDIPGHSKGWGALSEVGMEFCDDQKFQLYGDPNNNTLRILTEYLDEVLPIFPDEFVHFGCDELSNTGKCNPTNFAQLERGVFEYIHSKGKRPVTWEEALYSAGSTFPYNMVDAYQQHTASEINKDGYDSIESCEKHLYLDHVYEKHQWLDITKPNSVDNDYKYIKNKNDIGKFYGGEVSMWTDNYCYIKQCGTGSGKPIGYQLYDPKYNFEFHESLLSLIFPRTISGAGSFWRYDPNLVESSTEYKNYINYQNNRIRARGINTCPNDCQCNEISKCGVNYIK